MLVGAASVTGRSVAEVHTRSRCPGIGCRCCRRTNDAAELTSMCRATENGVAKQSSRRAIAGEITVSRFKTLAAWFAAACPSEILCDHLAYDCCTLWDSMSKGGTNHRPQIHDTSLSTSGNGLRKSLLRRCAHAFACARVFFDC